MDPISAEEFARNYADGFVQDGDKQYSTADWHYYFEDE